MAIIRNEMMEMKQDISDMKSEIVTLKNELKLAKLEMKLVISEAKNTISEKIEDERDQDLDNLEEKMDLKLENLKQKLDPRLQTSSRNSRKFVKRHPVNETVPLCLARGEHTMTHGQQITTGFTLYSSYRISFNLFLKSIDNNWYAIFRIGDTLNKNNHNRHPLLRIHAGNQFVLDSNRCNGYVDSWDQLSRQTYKTSNLKIKQTMAITIEYIRELNQSKFYLNGVELHPFDTENARINPNSVCYGIEGRLFSSDYHSSHKTADGSIYNFAYEENVTGQPLGGLSVEEINENICSQ